MASAAVRGLERLLRDGYLLEPAKRLFRRARGAVHVKGTSPGRPLRLAMIGSGKAARFHLEALRRIDDVQVTCIVNCGRSDPRPLMARYRIGHHFSSLRRALDEARFDAAIVAVTATETREVTATLLDSGISCLVEKPLGVTLDEARDLRDRAESASCATSVAYNRRFYSSILAAQEFARALGRPYSIHVEASEPVFELRERLGDEALRHRLVQNTTHAIDMFTLFGGPVVGVSPSGYRKLVDGIPADFMCFLRFRDGGTGSFLSHWCSPGENEVRLYGNGYKLDINLKRNTLKARVGNRTEKITEGDLDVLCKAGVYLQDLHFLRRVAGVSLGGAHSSPLASFEDGFRSLDLSLEILTRSYPES
jgi:predicted dehydrogenase